MTSLPSHIPLVTIAASGIAPASEPASGLVKAKHGMSVPTAKRGK